MASNENWTLQDYALLYQDYPSKGPVAVADEIHRTVNSVVSRATKMGINVPKNFTSGEKQIAKQYGDVLGTALIFLLPERTRGEVKELLRCEE